MSHAAAPIDYPEPWGRWPARSSYWRITAPSAIEGPGTVGQLVQVQDANETAVGFIRIDRALVRGGERLDDFLRRHERAEPSDVERAREARPDLATAVVNELGKRRRRPVRP